MSLRVLPPGRPRSPNRVSEARRASSAVHRGVVAPLLVSLLLSVGVGGLLPGPAMAGGGGRFDPGVRGDPAADLRDSGVFHVTLSESLPGVTGTELAGNSLAEYPFFEYVKAFNEDAPVELAIDPTRFPEIVGLSGDVYVVEVKGAAAWQVDRTLVDVTPGGPLAVTFGGATIQENTFLVAGPYDLPSAAFVEATGDFTGLGHGYDLVIDMNRNAMLDEGDYLDGYGREAGIYVVHDTTQRGPLAVTESAPTASGRSSAFPPVKRTRSSTTRPISPGWTRCR